MPEKVTCACCGSTLSRPDAYPYIHRLERFKTIEVYKCLDCHHAWAPVLRLPSEPVQDR